MFVFMPGVRIIEADTIIDTEINSILNIKFNVGHNIVAHKSILDFMFQLFYPFSFDQVKIHNRFIKDICFEQILGNLKQYKIIDDIHATSNNMLLNEKKELHNYVVHFPEISNSGIIIAVLLSKYNLNINFYHDKVISNNDVQDNIYFSDDDIGMTMISVLRNKLGMTNINLLNTDFSLNAICNDITIIVNTDYNKWVDNDNYKIINTWNYTNTNTDRLSLWKYKINISNDIQNLFLNYIIALRSIGDILYSFSNELVT